MFLVRFVLPTVIAVALLHSQVTAETLPVLSGPVILTVTGLDEKSFPDGTVDFDIPMLETIGRADITTSSIWTEGKHRYTGVMLQALAKFLKIETKTLKFHALNDYAIEFSAQDATDEGPILAYKMDGALMSVREKGPIWVIYPFDDGAQFRTDTNYARSIWQLDRIDVLR